MVFFYNSKLSNVVHANPKIFFIATLLRFANVAKTFFFHSFLVASQKSFNGSNLSSSSLSFSRSFTDWLFAVVSSQECPFPLLKWFTRKDTLCLDDFSSHAFAYRIATKTSRNEDMASDSLQEEKKPQFSLVSLHSTCCLQIRTIQGILTTCFAIESVHPGLLEEINVGGFFYWLTDF